MLEEKDRELAERDRQILGMDDQIAELRKELEESSKQVAGLRAKMEESEKALSSTKKKLKSAERKIKRLASTSAVIDGNRIKGEVFIVTMGANQPVKHEVSTELIRRMDLVVTDDLPTVQNDSGDLIAAHEAGILRWEDVVLLERLVAGSRLAGHHKRVLFQSNGIADEDLAVGRYVLNQVRRKKVRVRSVPEI